MWATQLPRRSGLHRRNHGARQLRSKIDVLLSGTLQHQNGVLTATWNAPVTVTQALGRPAAVATTVPITLVKPGGGGATASTRWICDLPDPALRPGALQRRHRPDQRDNSDAILTYNQTFKRR
jgi:hypothetical protein